MSDEKESDPALEEWKRAFAKEYAGAVTDEAAVQQAMKRFLYERSKKKFRGHVKETLGRIGRKETEEGFASVLQRAQAFTQQHLQQYWSRDLMALARPTGFADQAGTIVEITVLGDLYAWRMRTVELLEACRKVPGLEKTQKIRLKEVPGFS